MSLTDPRGELLHAFDAHAAAFSAAAADRAELGGPLSQGEIAHLTGLAGAIAASLADWRRRLEPLGLARRIAFEEARAGALVLESVFDDLLTPGAWRVLGAALDLAQRPAQATA
jgi:hypothetical protein